MVYDPFDEDRCTPKVVFFFWEDPSILSRFRRTSGKE
jgi:hypothetical protein